MIAFHRTLGTKVDTPLVFHWPPALLGTHWEVVPDASRPGDWWTGWALPFKAYSRPDMEHCIATYPDQFVLKPREIRMIDYPLDITQLSISGRRGLAYQNPRNPADQMWIQLAATQAMP